MIADVNGDTLTLIDAVRGADGLASRIAPDTPLIVLTARSDELARIRYLDRGGDDVLAKPYSYSELRARIRALLRRAGGPPAGRVHARRRARHRHARPAACTWAARRSRWPRRNTRCSSHLAGEPTKVFTKAELLREIWGYRTDSISRTLDSHACRLRLKLRAASSDGERWVENVWGVGYRLAPIGVRDPDPIAA